MKFLLSLFALFAVSSAQTCTHDLQVKCADDINKAFPICQKAAKQKAKDFDADLQCMKYFVSMDKDCWPCICEVAKKQGWKVKGCNNIYQS